MSQVIIFQPVDMPVAIMRAAPEVADFPLERVGQHGVPDGLPGWLVPESSIPVDEPLRNAWEIDVVTMGEPFGVGDIVAFNAWWSEETQRAAAIEGGEA